jgi:hypothetical protein
MAADRLHLTATGAELVSRSSRAVWHLPDEQMAVVITRPNTRSFEDVLGEAHAIHAAIAVGVRTPPILAGPVPLEAGRTALAYRWIERATPPTEPTWPDTVTQAARLAHARTEGIPRLRMTLGATPAQYKEVLGPELNREFTRHWRTATSIAERLLTTGPLVLCHGDLHPGNLLLDTSGLCWLVDFEYACLGPTEWDAAKIAILARRFNDPPTPEPLLTAWGPHLDPARLAECVTAQEALTVSWLVAMAVRGTTRATTEAQHRAATLGTGEHHEWAHLG